MNRRRTLAAGVSFPTEEQISARVYELFLKKQAPPSGESHWRIAETQLLEEAARQIPKLLGPARRP